MFAMIKGIKKEIESLNEKQSILEKIFLRYSDSFLEMRTTMSEMNS